MERLMNHAHGFLPRTSRLSLNKTKFYSQNAGTPNEGKDSQGNLATVLKTISDNLKQIVEKLNAEMQTIEKEIQKINEKK